jgi:hypothetical protein
MASMSSVGISRVLMKTTATPIERAAAARHPFFLAAGGLWIAAAVAACSKDRVRLTYRTEIKIFHEFLGAPPVRAEP